MPETHPLRIHVHLPRRISRGYMELTRACGDNDSNGDFAVGLYGRAPTVCVTERVLNVCCWHPGPVCPIGGRCRALLLPEAYKCRDVACALGTWTQKKFNLSIHFKSGVHEVLYLMFTIHIHRHHQSPMLTSVVSMHTRECTSARCAQRRSSRSTRYRDG